jgi:RNA polymerase sigma-70 factor, ECF subfamily
VGVLAAVELVPAASDDEAATEPIRRTVPGAQTEADVSQAYAEWHQDLFAFIVSATRDRELAEDLLQETFLRLVRETQAGRTPDNTRAWLYRVASNLVVSRTRRRAVAGRWLSHLVQSESGEAADAEVLRKEGRGDLERLLRNVSPEARVGLLLAAHGFSGAEVAATIGRTDGATRTLLCRARLHLRQLIQAEEGVA